MLLPARPVLALALATALAVGPGAARSQEAGARPSVKVLGRVKDASTGALIPEARVWLLTPDGEGVRIVWSGVSDERGGWITRPLPAGELELRVEAFGYRVATGSVDLSQGPQVDVRVELVPAPVEMEPLLVVSARRSRLDASGFHDRRRQGQGSSITREEFESRHPARASDVFRLLPGVSVQPGRGGGAGLLSYRGCSPDLVLDGVPLLGATAVDDVVAVMDIEAVEIQSGVLFPSRGMGSACGTVMIYTREGSRDEEGHPMTWRRAGAVAGLILLALLLTR